MWQQSVNLQHIVIYLRRKRSLRVFSVNVNSTEIPSSKLCSTINITLSTSPFITDQHDVCL